MNAVASASGEGLCVILDTRDAPLAERLKAVALQFTTHLATSRSLPRGVQQEPPASTISAPIALHDGALFI